MKTKAPQKHKVKEGLKKNSNNSFNPDRDPNKVRLKGAPYMRDRATIKRLQMYRTGKAKRDTTGKITKPAIFQSWVPSGTQARVAPHIKWFQNSKVIKQDSLQTFQEELGKVMKDPYKLVMKQTSLPVTLLNETAKQSRVHILDTEPYSAVFGPKKTRKRPMLKHATAEEMVKHAEEELEAYEREGDTSIKREDDGSKVSGAAWFTKVGTSRRIWSELYKVVDSSDVVIIVLDSRDPQGTRPRLVEKYITENCPHKHIIFVLNKVDLVPVWVTQKWSAILSHERPTMAFHSSMNNSFGKGALIQLLRQFSVLHKDKKNISVGMVGYPNVGKSSIINTLRAKKVCNVAPLAGETKVWQYVTLMNRIFLIDCPGIVPESHEEEQDVVLKGLVRIEYLKNPVDYVQYVMEKCRHDYLSTTYKVPHWTTVLEFLEKVARRTGKLGRGGEPDLNTAAKSVLTDFQRGKIPYFTPPEGHDSKAFETLKKAENEELERITQEKLDEEMRLEQLAAGNIAEKSQLTYRTEMKSDQQTAVDKVLESRAEDADDEEKETEEEEQEKKELEKQAEKSATEEAKKSIANHPVRGVVQKLSAIRVAHQFDEDDLGVAIEQEENYDYNDEIVSDDEEMEMGDDGEPIVPTIDENDDSYQVKIDQFIKSFRTAGKLEKPEDLLSEFKENKVESSNKVDRKSKKVKKIEKSSSSNPSNPNILSNGKDVQKPRLSKDQRKKLKVATDMAEISQASTTSDKKRKLVQDSAQEQKKLKAKLSEISTVSDVKEKSKKKQKLTETSTISDVKEKSKKKQKLPETSTISDVEEKSKLNVKEKSKKKQPETSTISEVKEKSKKKQKKVKVVPESSEKIDETSSPADLASDDEMEVKHVSSKTNEDDSDDDCPQLVGASDLSSSEDEAGGEGWGDMEQMAVELTDPALGVREVSAAPKHLTKIRKVRKMKKHVDDDVKELFDQANIEVKSSKAKRKEWREDRKAKNPIRFYDVVDVKNRNRNKAGVVDEVLATRGHSKKKPVRKAKK